MADDKLTQAFDAPEETRRSLVGLPASTIAGFGAQERQASGEQFRLIQGLMEQKRKKQAYEDSLVEVEHEGMIYRVPPHQLPAFTNAGANLRRAQTAEDTLKQKKDEFKHEKSLLATDPKTGKKITQSDLTAQKKLGLEERQFTQELKKDARTLSKETLGLVNAVFNKDKFPLETRKVIAKEINANANMNHLLFYSDGSGFLEGITDSKNKIEEGMKAIPLPKFYMNSRNERVTHVIDDTTGKKVPFSKAAFLDMAAQEGMTPEEYFELKYPNMYRKIIGKK